MTADVVSRLALGLALGAASGMLPGPCYLAVLTAARQGRARAWATGLGAALGDLGYAALGVSGAGLALARPAPIATALQLLGGLGLVAYGLAQGRARTRPTAEVSDRAAAPVGRGVGRGVATGLATVLVNPGALVTWGVLAGSILTAAGSGARWAGVIGVGVGSFAAYAAVGRWGGTGRDVARVRAVVGRVVVATGAVTLVGVARGWLLT